MTIGQCATWACLLELLAPKPGNVHRSADFAELTCYEFAAAAVAFGPAFQAAAEGRTGVGATVLAAVQAARSVVASNTHLGTILLLAPLACVPRAEPFSSGVPRVLRALTADDARDVYEAIRLAKPGGLGQVTEADIHTSPPQDLRAAMRLAADRDLVARQYAEDFALVLGPLRSWLLEYVAAGHTLPDAILWTFVKLLSCAPDSLIARKCGAAVAQEGTQRAARVFAAGPPGSEEAFDAVADLDFWLRSDGQKRNPGTSADLLAATLFVILRDGDLRPPYRFRPGKNCSDLR